MEEKKEERRGEKTRETIYLDFTEKRGICYLTAVFFFFFLMHK